VSSMRLKMRFRTAETHCRHSARCQVAGARPATFDTRGLSMTAALAAWSDASAIGRAVTQHSISVEATDQGRRTRLALRPAKTQAQAGRRRS
jgi:hypothetical protein